MIVATIMATLAFQGAVVVLRQATNELRLSLSGGAPQLIWEKVNAKILTVQATQAMDSQLVVHLVDTTFRRSRNFLGAATV